MAKIKLIVADNGEIFRRGLTLLFKDIPDIEVLAVCSSGSEAVEKVAGLNPDIVIIDKYLKDPGFLEVCKNIRRLSARTRIVVSQPFMDSDYLSALKAEADAYIDKDIPVDILSRILLEINAGHGFLSPSIAALVLKESAATKESTNWEFYQRQVALTQRETQILSLMAQKGMSNKEIASTLFITEGTVKVHLTRIFEKMSVRGRHKAAALAREKGIICQDSTPR